MGDIWRKFGGKLGGFGRTFGGNLEEIKRRLEVKNLVLKNLVSFNPSFFLTLYNLPTSFSGALSCERRPHCSEQAVEER